ncbi:EF-P lysine aminoacylase EpmA [Thiocystis violascens]|uniref:Lysyl-tRNA synthetase-like protein GenX n=1 Tax=Thiocystis violascens (strain ATCC 17096 / DSM 198 / 6111) TaxID=765911 RepID=I3Y5M5_THIV6|nr:EF-P lysine aminoacylase EpmA [Thiocystis violascens]AFL72293.1 lysyl-tRNA synthetase-like protein GenX [Thiocystis violascens DSM 198]
MNHDPAGRLPNDWRSSAALAMLQARADLLARLRGFFALAGVLEVETPILSQAAVTDPALASLAVGAAGAGGGSGRTLYLQTSPEFPMKRLLASGSGPIYQICKVFRDDERGRFHHPEFSLLEWYRPGWDHRRLMDEVAELVRTALQRPAMPVERIGYRELFLKGLELDPWLATVEDLRGAALAAGIADAARLDLDADAWLDLLLTHCLESSLGRGGMTFLVDYPPSQAALARIRPGSLPVAERFELYIEGVELANGFGELTDPVEQRARFQADLATRRQRGQREPPLDERFLAALTAGMPECAGVALGIDRLLMMATGAGHIDAVLAFPVERA